MLIPKTQILKKVGFSLKVVQHFVIVRYKLPIILAVVKK